MSYYQAVLAAIASRAEDEPEPVTPSVGAVTPYVLNTATDQGSYSFSHTRAAGAGLQISAAGYRSNSTTTPSVTGVTFGGQALTERGQDKENGLNHIGCAHFSLDPGVGPEGSQTVVVTLSATAARDAVIFAADIIDTAGAQQGVAEVYDDAGDTAAAKDITPSDAASLLVSAGACIDGGGTVSEGATWTASAASAASNTDANAVDGILQHKAPASTSVQSATVSFSANRAMRAIGAVEWLPS